jgi:serine/threonine protein kinase
MMRELFDDQSEPSAPPKVVASLMTSFSDLYSVRDLLGVGAFGVVLYVKNKATEEKSALKIINKDNLSKNALAILKNESCIMKSMQHGNVVKFKRIFENVRFLMIEMEYIKGGQLKRLYKREVPLSDQEAALVIKSLL